MQAPTEPRDDHGVAAMPGPSDSWGFLKWTPIPTCRAAGDLTLQLVCRERGRRRERPVHEHSATSTTTPSCVSLSTPNDRESERLDATTP